MISAHKQSGFTLIELLITMVISGILMTVGINKYIDFNKTQAIKSAGLTLKNNLRDIQGKATTGIKPATCTNLTNLNGYQVVITSTTSYTSRAICSGVATGSTTTYALPMNIFIHSPGSGNSFNLLTIGQGASANTTIILKNSLTSPNKWYSICISKGGNIIDCGYSTGATAPSCSCQ